MPFKTTPSTVAKIEDFLTSLLPIRKSGRPISKPPWRIDPEICRPLYEYYITNAFAYVAAINAEITAFGGECTKLATCLAGKSVTSLDITCANCDGGRTSSSEDDSIQLCLDAYGLTLSQNLVNSLVFRELIRMCGGKELDAWGLDSYFNYVDPGPPAVYFALPPGVKGWMCAGGTPGTGALTGIRFGNFVVWDSVLGKLFTRELTPEGLGSAIISGGGSAWQYHCP